MIEGWDVQVTVEDLEEIDIDFYKNMKWMLENDVTGLETTFTATAIKGNSQVEIDLVPGGSQKEVTENNKKEFVQRMTEWKLKHSAKDQVTHFLEGLSSLLPSEEFKLFSENEIELLVAGLPSVDVDDWERNTQYSGYSSSDGETVFDLTDRRSSDLVLESSAEDVGARYWIVTSLYNWFIASAFCTCCKDLISGRIFQSARIDRFAQIHDISGSFGLWTRSFAFREHLVS